MSTRKYLRRCLARELKSAKTLEILKKSSGGGHRRNRVPPMYQRLDAVEAEPAAPEPSPRSLLSKGRPSDSTASDVWRDALSKVRQDE